MRDATPFGAHRPRGAAGVWSPKRQARQQRAERTPGTRLPVSCERLRLALPERCAVALERLDEVLNGPGSEAALNQFWNSVDQAYDKPTEHVEVQAGPIPPEELATWSDAKIADRLNGLEATCRREEDG